MAAAVEACVHCGFCLAACPTYAVLGEEMESPRGRIILMKSVLEGELTARQAQPHIDHCLGCLACVPACPSGVAYGELLPLYRGHVDKQVARSPIERLAHTAIHETLPHPGRFRTAAAAGGLGQVVKGALPRPFQAMLDLLPATLPRADPLPALIPAEGPRRARVALLTGCVQQALNPGINWATARVLARNGVEVVVPDGQGCCGSLAFHAGDLARARDLARVNVRVFPKNVDAILTNAAGCGSGMKEYGVIFAGQPEAVDARIYAGRVKDVTEFLDALGLIGAPSLPAPVRVAYHDACHLAHAQGVTAAPRRLLSAIAGLELAEIPEGDMCCGSAGTYNIEQPELAATFGRRKAQNVVATGAPVVATGNIGCLIQIRSHLRAAGQARRVFHTLEVLDRAYRGQSLTREED